MEKAPKIDINNIKEIPIALFVGKYDKIANINDNRMLKKQLESIIHYEEINASHPSFVIGNNMSYF